MNDPWEAYSLSQMLSNIGAEYNVFGLKEIGQRIVEMERENAVLRTEIYLLRQQANIQNTEINQ